MSHAVAQTPQAAALPALSKCLLWLLMRRPLRSKGLAKYRMDHFIFLRNRVERHFRGLTAPQVLEQLKSQQWHLLYDRWPFLAQGLEDMASRDDRSPFLASGNSKQVYRRSRESVIKLYKMECCLVRERVIYRLLRDRVPLCPTKFFRHSCHQRYAEPILSISPELGNLLNDAHIDNFGMVDGATVITDWQNLCWEKLDLSEEEVAVLLQNFSDWPALDDSNV